MISGYAFGAHIAMVKAIHRSGFPILQARAEKRTPKNFGTTTRYSQLSMSKRNLLICFDAFGTLFTPKTPVHVQYAEVAQSLGLGPFNEGTVKSSFREGMFTRVWQ